jgi:hypothetical protein
MSIEPPSHQEDTIGKAIVQAAYTVHKALGPGLLEQIYEWVHFLMMSQLKLTQRRLGYLINFNVPLIKNGIKRIAL